MKTNPLVATVFLALVVCSDSVHVLLAKTLQVASLLASFASKYAADLSFSWSFVSTAIALAHNAFCDGRFFVFVALNAAMWLGKVFLIAAVFSGHSK